MKSILKFVCGFCISAFLFAFITSILYYFITSKRFLLNVAKQTNYYEKATIEIKRNLEHQIINDDLKESVIVLITEDRVKTDVNRMVTSLFKNKDVRNIIKNEVKIDFQSAIEKELENKNFDESSLNDLVDTLTISYVKDLFPYSEYSLLESKLIRIDNLLLISFFLLLILIIFILISFFINPTRPIQILCRSTFCVGILIMGPFCFCHLYQLFKNFYYSNLHFSLYIKETFYSIINLLGVFGIVLIIGTIILEIHHLRKINNNKI